MLRCFLTRREKLILLKQSQPILHVRAIVRLSLSDLVEIPLEICVQCRWVWIIHLVDVGVTHVLR